MTLFTYSSAGIQTAPTVVKTQLITPGAKATSTAPTVVKVQMIIPITKSSSTAPTSKLLIGDFIDTSITKKIAINIVSNLTSSLLSGE